MAISGSDSQAPISPVSKPVSQAVAAAAAAVEVESVKCDSCCFTEECTPAYISRLRQRYQGRWLCGLCSEAVKDELLRSQRHITVEEAVDRHISVCKEFRSSSSTKTEHPIFAMGRIIRRNLDTPRRPLRSNSIGPGGAARAATLVRSESCFSSISG